MTRYRVFMILVLPFTVALVATIAWIERMSFSEAWGWLWNAE